MPQKSTLNGVSSPIQSKSVLGVQLSWLACIKLRSSPQVLQSLLIPNSPILSKSHLTTSFNNAGQPSALASSYIEVKMVLISKMVFLNALTTLENIQLQLTRQILVISSFGTFSWCENYTCTVYFFKKKNGKMYTEKNSTQIQSRQNH